MNNPITTVEKIIYLEKLVESKGCPPSEVMPTVMQLLNYCKKHNKCVTEIELIEK